MRAFRYRIAYFLRLLAYKIEPHPSLLDLHVASLSAFNRDPWSSPWPGKGED